MEPYVETCRQQDRPVFDYLTEAVAAHFQRSRCPQGVNGYYPA